MDSLDSPLKERDCARNLFNLTEDAIIEELLAVPDGEEGFVQPEMSYAASLGSFL